MQPQLSEKFSFVQHVDPNSSIYCHGGSSLGPACSCDDASSSVRRFGRSNLAAFIPPSRPLVENGNIGGINPWTGEALSGEHRERRPAPFPEG